MGAPPRRYCLRSILRQNISPEECTRDPSNTAEGSPTKVPGCAISADPETPRKPQAGNSRSAQVTPPRSEQNSSSSQSTPSRIEQGSTPGSEKYSYHKHQQRVSSAPPTPPRVQVPQYPWWVRPPPELALHQIVTAFNYLYNYNANPLYPYEQLASKAMPQHVMPTAYQYHPSHRVSFPHGATMHSMYASQVC